MSNTSTRTALVVSSDPLRSVQNYLPGNYTAAQADGGPVIITGIDNAGWTLDGYVLPRLRSGLITAKEVPYQYNITCCECGHHAGHTECEVTATSPTMCETCHDELLEEVETSNLPPAGTHGDW